MRVRLRVRVAVRVRVVVGVRVRVRVRVRVGLPQEVHHNGEGKHSDAYTCGCLRAIRNNELIRNILSVSGVEGIFLSKDFISVNKHDENSWDDIKHIVISHINEFYASGKEFVINKDLNEQNENFDGIEKIECPLNIGNTQTSAIDNMSAVSELETEVKIIFFALISLTIFSHFFL